MLLDTKVHKCTLRMRLQHLDHAGKRMYKCGSLFCQQTICARSWEIFE